MSDPLPSRPVNRAMAYETDLVPAMFRPWSEELITRVSPQPGDRVLNVACGTGIIARQVSPQVGTDGSVVGLDINPSMLDVARSLPSPDVSPIAWYEGSGDELPFPAASFDLVLCQQGLQSLPNRPATVREMRRVVTGDGTVGVGVWRSLDHQPALAILDDALERHFGFSVTDPFSLGDATELRSLFSDAGFRAVKLKAVTRDVRFPSMKHFVQMIGRSAAAVTPELAQLDDHTLNAMIDTVAKDADAPLQPYRDGEGLTFPMEAHIVVATP